MSKDIVLLILFFIHTYYNYICIIVFLNTTYLVLTEKKTAIDDPNEKKYTGNEMALKTLQT
jgi:hypothetical protein